MATKSKSANRIDQMFRAFSDRTRLRILYLLRDREYCVGDLVQILNIEQPAASRHLAYLRRAGLVSVRKEGTWAYYALVPAKKSFHVKLLDCLGTCFAEVPEIRADAQRAAKIRGSGGCCPPDEPSPAPSKSDSPCCEQ